MWKPFRDFEEFLAIEFSLFRWILDHNPLLVLVRYSIRIKNILICILDYIGLRFLLFIYLFVCMKRGKFL